MSFSLCYLHMAPAHNLATQKLSYFSSPEKLHLLRVALTAETCYFTLKDHITPSLWYLCDTPTLRNLVILSEKRHLRQLMKQKENYISQREKVSSRWPMVCLLLEQTISSFNAFQHVRKAYRSALGLKDSYKNLCYLALNQPVGF